MSCNTGIHRLTEQVLNNRPWFGYKEGDNMIKILDSPNGRINKKTSVGAANSLASKLNEIINDGYKKLGQVYYPIFFEDRGAVQIAPTNKQLDLINAEESKEVEKLQKQVDFENKKKAFYNKQKEGNYDVNEEGDIILLEDNDLEESNDLEQLYKEYPEVSEAMKLIEKQCR